MPIMPIFPMPPIPLIPLIPRPLVIPIAIGGLIVPIPPPIIPVLIPVDAPMFMGRLFIPDCCPRPPAVGRFICPGFESRTPMVLLESATQHNVSSI
jgi:hypothetical protein